MINLVFSGLELWRFVVCYFGLLEGFVGCLIWVVMFAVCV